MSNRGWMDVGAARQRWIEAQRFKIKVRRLLAPEKVSFTQWLVLEGILEVDHPQQPCVYQLLVAERLNLSERVVSYTMNALVERGLVERDAEDFIEFWNVQLTQKGHEVLQHCRQRLVDAARNFSLNLAA